MHAVPANLTGMRYKPVAQPGTEQGYKYQAEMQDLEAAVT